jgi:hypothetical protein
MVDDEDLDDGGDELDLEAIEREAARVERRALDLDFSDVVPDATASGLAGRRHGAASLETDTFLSRREREAMARARGETPTLKKMGKKAPRPVRADTDFAGLPMDTELHLSSKGLPGWVWATLTIVLVAALVTAGGFWLHARTQDAGHDDIAALEAARERARAEEEARLRRLQAD